MRLLVASLLFLALAGCTTPGGAGDDGEDLASLEATATTGVLRGVVVDAAVVPVEGARVTLLGNQTETRTDANGLFGFDGLEPGIHFLRVEKKDFFSTELSVPVRAGDDEPERARVELVRDPEKVPFVQASTWNGFIQCSLRAETIVLGPTGLAACSAGEPTVDLDDDVYHEIAFGGRPHFVQTDMEWTSSQPLGTQMSLRYGPDDCADVKWGSAEGTSPVSLTMGAALLEDKAIGPDEGLCARVFVWVSDTATDLVGAQVQQSFETYTHAFYNTKPPEGWSFPVDGAPPV